MAAVSESAGIADAEEFRQGVISRVSHAASLIDRINPEVGRVSLQKRYELYVDALHVPSMFRAIHLSRSRVAIWRAILVAVCSGSVDLSDLGHFLPQVYNYWTDAAETPRMRFNTPAVPAMIRCVRAREIAT